MAHTRKKKIPKEIRLMVWTDVFESVKHQLLHDKMGEDPFKVIDETVEDLTKSGYIDKDIKEEVRAKAKSYMKDFIKKYGEPPKVTK